MEINIKRYSISTQTTLGILFINGKFICYTLENTKLMIPPGIYKLKLREYGTFYKKYIKKFKFHRGMIEIIAEGRTDILFHGGNYYRDTKGCILPGDKANNNDIEPGCVERSLNAYEIFYKAAIEGLENEDVKLIIENI